MLNIYPAMNLLEIIDNYYSYHPRNFVCQKCWEINKYGFIRNHFNVYIKSKEELLARKEEEISENLSDCFQKKLSAH